ncbi:MAG: NAD(P)H-dependent glycerol-3-phosphate dehydrogenase [Bradymonadales bacterium]|jgi:glycerol-3-phosphate dehydrogenase (NAD(P)+)
MPDSIQIGVLGAGAWGTALAKHLAHVYSNVRIWAYEKECVACINEYHINAIFLPNVRLPDNIIATNNLDAFMHDLSHLVIVTPSHKLREVLSKIAPNMPRHCKIICATKGIESGSLMLMSELISDVLGERAVERLAVLSGPSFALHVAEGRATSLSIAAENQSFAVEMQHFISHSAFRAYWNCDLIGVQLGGALKNVIAIAAGACEGLQLGDNALAALVTRGLAEMTRLAVMMGGSAQTMSGLSGLGDLVLTCYGDLSRNRQLGLAIGKGKTLVQATEDRLTVAEGVKTAACAYALANKYDVDMPITQRVYEALYHEKNAIQALDELLERELKHDGC